jgi:SOS-response transcriptional repressor LexA
VVAEDGRGNAAGAAGKDDRDENGDREDNCRPLQGKALQVYLYLRRRKNEPAGIREIQRDLGLSSPSVAEYQVEKLEGMGLVSRDNYGRVSVAGKKKVKVKELQSHVSLGRFFVPRLAFYASIFSAVAILYAVFNLDNLSVYGVAVPAAAAAVLWLEAYKMWKASRELEVTAAAGGRKEAARENEGRILPLLIPGIVALAVFAGTGAFLLQYQQQHAAAPAASSPFPLLSLQAPPAPAGAGGPTLEESVELSRQKVAAATASAGGTATQALDVHGSSAAMAMPLAGALVVAFLAYVLVRYRSGSVSYAAVLEAEQPRGALSGTQDYPERLP